MMYRLACEYSRFSSLLAFRDVSPRSLAARSMQGVTAVFVGYIQLFRERLSEKVHETIPKGIVGGF